DQLTAEEDAVWRRPDRAIALISGRRRSVGHRHRSGHAGATVADHVAVGIDVAVDERAAIELKAALPGLETIVEADADAFGHRYPEVPFGRPILSVHLDGTTAELGGDRDGSRGIA